MRPSSPYAVQQSCEQSSDLSDNTTLLWPPRALSPAGFLREVIWVEHTGVLQNFPCKPFGNHCTSLLPLQVREQADEEEEVTPTGTFWEYDLAPNLF